MSFPQQFKLGERLLNDGVQKSRDGQTTQAVSASFQSKIIFPWRSESQTFSPDFSLSLTLFASTECLQSVINKD